MVPAEHTQQSRNSCREVKDGGWVTRTSDRVERLVLSFVGYK